MKKPKTLYDAETIKKRIAKMAEEISAEYGDNPLYFVTILRGSMIFAADLMRALDLDVRLDFMIVKSYLGTESSGKVDVIKFIDSDISGKHILIIEDIVDTGNTASKVHEMLKRKTPASVEICALLDKPSRRQVQISAKFVGFTIPDKFVVGFGLDYEEKYRNLPFVGYLEDGE